MAETTLENLGLKIEKTETDDGKRAYNVYDTKSKAPDYDLIARYKINPNGDPVGNYYNKKSKDQREPLISAYIHGMDTGIISIENKNSIDKT